MSSRLKGTFQRITFLRSIDRFVELSKVRQELTRLPYGGAGRPWIDPWLMIRMLILGSCFGVHSERRLLRRGPPQYHHLNRFSSIVFNGPLQRTVGPFPRNQNRFTTSARATCCSISSEIVLLRCIREDFVSSEGFRVNAGLDASGRQPAEEEVEGGDGSAAGSHGSSNQR